MQEIRQVKRPGKCEGCGEITNIKQIDPYDKEVNGRVRWIYLHFAEDCIRVLTDEI